MIEEEAGFAKATKKKVVKLLHVNDEPVVTKLGNLKIEKVNHDNLSDEVLEDLITGD